MFDADRRLVVANNRLAELLRVPAEVIENGVSARGMIGEAALSGVVLEPERLSSEVEERLAGTHTGDLVIDTGAGTVLSLTFQPMDNGGSVVLVEDITARRDAEARIDQLARYDPLTGLPNRNFLRDQMELALAATRRQSRSCAVFFIDLDHFKQVNDTLGHRYGDRILCAVADRLRRIMGPEDFVARFGGDEFIAIVPLLSGRASAEASAERIVEELAEPYEVEGHQIVLGASVGIAVAPDHSSDPDRLLKQSDTALYQAKSSGRGAWCFFEHEMAVKAQARRSLELDLRSALAENAFEVFYQPLFNLKTKSFNVCEALVRWRHPERGMISPAEFIPVAEEMGIIVEIGAWVLERACTECLNWPSDVGVAVNLSPIQFRRGSVVGSVTEALLRSGLQPSRLEVEITESVLLQDVQQTRGALAQVRALGVKISLDDFGTGYSSLSYLHSFQLNKVKIDRSFLQGLGSSDRSLILLRGVARLSAELGMVVAVEGVETQEQLDLVDCHGDVDEVQGYLFGRPMPTRDIREFLAKSAAARSEKVA
jgi:diguanylate cyclase (GGDEF)-like protein